MTKAEFGGLQRQGWRIFIRIGSFVCLVRKRTSPPPEWIRFGEACRDLQAKLEQEFIEPVFRWLVKKLPSSKN